MSKTTKNNHTPLDMKKYKPKKKGHFARNFVISFLSIGFLVSTVVLALFIYYFIFYDLPSPHTLKDYKAVALSTHIYDRNGKLLYEVYGDENRTPIKLKDLPKYVGQASIAIEDKDFYKHTGVSIFSGILRAMKDTFLTKKVQGGSTITQQLVKGALLSPERTLQRKAKEIFLAMWVERIFKKDEILEMYLNQVPYGGSSYGIEQASLTYFNKHAKKLTLAEAALLAGLPQAPSSYSPYINPELAKNRRDEVLKVMYEQGYITDKQRKEAQKLEVKVQPPKVNIKAPHFVFEVRKQLEDQYGVNQIEEGGLRVTTTLDLDIQEEAEKIVRDEIDKIRNLNVTNGAALVTRPGTGEVLAMVGSVDYFATPSGAFNITTTDNRQPGSTVKPINYAIGIDRKIVTAATVFLDAPTCYPSNPKPYCPKNYDNSFHGPVSLRSSLANSYNIPAVKMLKMNGVETFVASSSGFLITTLKDPKDYGLALTLGGAQMKMTELAQAFSAFSNRGKPRKLNYVLKIENKVGKEIYSFKDPNFKQDVRKPLENPNFLAMSGKRIISEETAFIISHIMQDNGARTPAFGPNSALNIKGKSVSVKTGTTNDYKDNWTIGYTSNFLTAVWVGNNDNSEMRGVVSGVTGAAPIWNGIMTYILKDQPNLPPIKPAGVVGLQVCNDTGAVAGKAPEGGSTCPSHFEYLTKGANNKNPISAPTRQMIPVNKNTDKMTTPNDPDMEMREKTVIKDNDGLYCIDCAH